MGESINTYFSLILVSLLSLILFGCDKNSISAVPILNVTKQLDGSKFYEICQRSKCYFSTANKEDAINVIEQFDQYDLCQSEKSCQRVVNKKH